MRAPSSVTAWPRLSASIRTWQRKLLVQQANQTHWHFLYLLPAQRPSTVGVDGFECPQNILACPVPNAGWLGAVLSNAYVNASSGFCKDQPRGRGLSHAAMLRTPRVESATGYEPCFAARRFAARSCRRSFDAAAWACCAFALAERVVCASSSPALWASGSTSGCGSGSGFDSGASSGSRGSATSWCSGSGGSFDASARDHLSSSLSRSLSRSSCDAYVRHGLRWYADYIRRHKRVRGSADVRQPE